ncbi:MAG: PilZ domain-containing protein [Vulcanococcus sp.]
MAMAGLRLWKRNDRPQPRTASTPAPRRSSRFSLPFGASALKAKLTPADLGLPSGIQAQLWDVSDEGGCLSIPGPCSLPVPGTAVLELSDPHSRQSKSLPVELRWISAIGHATFVGLRFVSGPLPSDSFLREYMQVSWTDAVPGSTRFA